MTGLEADEGSVATSDLTLVPAGAAWDTSYEWKSIAVLSLGFGLVSFDRSLMMPMFPVIMKDLHLSYTDLGNITGALAFTWGISAFVMGKVSDSVGRKGVLIGAMIAFSLLVGLSGLAAGALSLILVRALMGTAEGAYCPPSLVATLEAAKPSRHGLALGIQQMTAPLLGMAVAPILVTQLAGVINWRYIFLIATPPGLIIAFLLWRTIRETAQTPETHAEVHAGRFRDLLAYRNVALAALCMMTWLNALFVLTAFLPNYFVDYLKLPLRTMGGVMSAIGFGSVLGSVALPALSDRLGRKLTTLIAVLGSASMLAVLSRTGPDPRLLFLCLGTAAFFIYGGISLTVGPLSIESVPVHLRATASGTVIAVGEIFGGGVAPVVAGYLAHHFGITSIFPLAISGFAIGLIASLFLKETAPSKLGVAHA